MNADYYKHVGDQYAAERKWSAALRAYDRAISMETHDPETYLGRGMVYYQLKRYQAALEDFNMVVQLAPLHSGGY
ncbi:MAG TPA: tetratricopeptide repeat protein, partial [Anaerolineaceae bacterium]|nr:tetratricopeptide repeat protein [Anaerolineaceae bacterium]